MIHLSLPSIDIWSVYFLTSHISIFLPWLYPPPVPLISCQVSQDCSWFTKLASSRCLPPARGLSLSVNFGLGNFRFWSGLAQDKTQQHPIIILSSTFNIKEQARHYLNEIQTILAIHVFFLHEYCQLQRQQMCRMHWSTTWQKDKESQFK